MGVATLLDCYRVRGDPKKKGNDMKTTRVLGLLLLPTILGFVLASCGGSGGGSKTRTPRLNFQIGEFIIQNPTNGEKNVCLQPDIEIVVPYNSNLCNNGSDLADWIQVRKVDGEQTVDLLNTITFRRSNDSRTCIVETRPSRALIPESDYYISIDKSGGGSFIFRPGSAAEFTTTDIAGNANCRNAFKIADTRNWEETGVLDFGQYDRDEDEIIFDDEDLINFSLDSLASALLGFVFPTMPTTQFIQFNSPVRDLSLESQIRVYEYSPGSNPNSFSVFERRSLGTRCQGESEDPAGRCVYVDPLDDHTVIVQFPTGYLSDGLYVLFVLDGLKARNGKFLNSTYYKIMND
jgi:hypothetical protein